jgi:hypothetical protein
MHAAASLVIILAEPIQPSCRATKLSAKFFVWTELLAKSPTHTAAYSATPRIATLAIPASINHKRRSNGCQFLRDLQKLAAASNVANTTTANVPGLAKNGINSSTCLR